MKTINKLGLHSLFLGLVVVFFASCNAITYEGDYSKEGFYQGPKDGVEQQIYFVKEGRADSITYSFGTKPESLLKDTIQVPVRITGFKAKKKMSFKVSVDHEKSTAVENVNYKALENQFVVLPDSVNAFIPVILYREGLSQEANMALKIVMRLEGTADLGIAFADGAQMSIVFDNEVQKPVIWQYLEPYLGPFTPKKFLKMLELYDGDSKTWYESPYTPAWFATYGKLYTYFKNHPEDKQEIPYDMLKLLVPDLKK